MRLLGVRAAVLAIVLAGCATPMPKGLTKAEGQLFLDTVGELTQAVTQAKDASGGIIRRIEQEWSGLTPRTPTVRLKEKWVYADKKEREGWMFKLFRDYNAVLTKRGLPTVDRFLLQTPLFWEEWFPPELRAGDAKP